MKLNRFFIALGLPLAMAQVGDVIDLTKVTYEDWLQEPLFSGHCFAGGGEFHRRFRALQVHARSAHAVACPMKADRFCSVRKGFARQQLKGGPIIEFRAGETAYAPPGVPHWQGSTPTTSGTQFNVQRGKITWLNDVTDEEYNGPVAPRK